MKRPFFMLMLCYCLLAACNSREPKFPIEETLKQELISLQGITSPFMLEVKHPFLIILNNERSDSIFHIYDLTSNELKSVFGVKGQSIKETSTPWKFNPDEFFLPVLYSTQLSDIFIGDEIRRLVYRFGISEDGLPVFKETKRYNDTIDNMFEAAFIGDSIYVLDAQYQSPSLYILSLNEESPRKIKQFRNPEIMDYYADPDMGRVYANEGRIALCYGWKKQIDFMDTEFNLIKRIKFKFDDPVEMTTENQGDIKASYVYGYFGKRYLYIIFFGTSWNEHRSSYRGTSLEVYDLDGNPVARYQFDGISPSRFVVDEATFTLYGVIDMNKVGPNDNLLVYRLKGLS